MKIGEDFVVDFEIVLGVGLNKELVVNTIQMRSGLTNDSYG